MSDSHPASPICVSMADVLALNAAELQAELDAWRTLCSTEAERLAGEGKLCAIEARGGREARLLGEQAVVFKDDDFVELLPYRPLDALSLGELRKAGTQRAELVRVDGETLSFTTGLAAGRYWLLPSPPLEDLYHAVARETRAWQQLDDPDPFQDVPAAPPPLHALLQRAARVPLPQAVNHAELEAAWGHYTSLPPMALLQGPPGTGKTRLLAKLMASWARQGAAVGVCAFTNRAVDELLGACRDHAGIELARVGRQRVREELPHVVERKRMEPKPGSCVGATLFKVNTSYAGQSSPPRFDVLVLDEASQVWLGPALVLGRLAKALVVVGDPQQLPPLLKTRAPDEPATAAQCSLIELGLQRAEPSATYFLRESYRLNPPVCAQISVLFYGGRLLSHASNATRIWPDASRAEAFAPRPGIVFVEAQSADLEAQRVAELILACERVHGAWLGAVEAELGATHPRYLVSCFYRVQIDRVRRALAAAGVDPRRWRLDTVERNQGRTGSVGLLSLGGATSDRENAFFAQSGRWTVALSRGRFKTLVVGRSRGLLPKGIELETVA